MNFDIDKLEPGIAELGSVQPDQLALLVAYSQAVSLKRIADLMAAGGPVVNVDAASLQTVNLVRSGQAAPNKSRKVSDPTAAVPTLPADFTPWDGIGQPGIDRVADVVVFYRRGKSSRKLAAGQVTWSHSGGPDDVLAYRVIGDGSSGDAS